MFSLMRLQRTTRLIFLSAVLGVVGALGAELFVWLLDLSQHWILTAISGYKYIEASQAHAMGAAPPSGWHFLIPVATTLGGLISGILVYGLAPEAGGHGTDAAGKGYHRTAGPIRYRISGIKNTRGAVTIAPGGSAGGAGPTGRIAAGVGAR